MKPDNNLKERSDEYLEKYKKEYENLVQTHGEITYHNIIRIKDIFLDKEGDLTISFKMQRTKIKDLLFEDSGEKIFADVYQDNNYLLSDRNLNFILSEWKEYNKLAYRLNQIVSEIRYRLNGEYPQFPVIPMNFLPGLLAYENDSSPDDKIRHNYYEAYLPVDNGSNETKLVSMHGRSINNFTLNSTTELKSFRKGDIKNACKELYQKLLNDKVIDLNLNETKLKPAISNIIIPMLEKEYILTSANKRTIKDYFRKAQIRAEKRNSVITVIAD